MPETLSDWLAHLEARHPKGEAGIELGLERVLAVSRVLEQRQNVPVITVAGTNGKGSTCAMLERILACAGYRVGLYTSPHLLTYNERVRIGGRPADDAALCAGFARVEAARGNTALTYFEFGTLAAWECFAAANVDVIVLEVGLGGRFDATNIYDTDCAVVTAVDIDHTEYLGATREKIGFEKAGIFRAGRPAICADPQPPQSLLAHAAKIGTGLHLIGTDFGYVRQEGQWQFWIRSDGKLTRRSGLAYPGLRGAVQLHNASAALAALSALQQRLPVAMQDIRRGLLEVELPGRFQVLPGRPAVVLDVAHNPQAARVLADNLGTMTFHAQTWAVFGMLRDKDIAAVVRALAGRVTRWLPCSLSGARAASAADLAQILTQEKIGPSLQFDSPAEAFRHARKNAGEDDRIIAFGSFLTVADVLREMA
ncbi:MAG: bifunctional tetrahydrofolate synthase/dihydrofolate synthase [Betaproteobacteria bacterium]|nr:bifunctional tetrahydrofolate synthase/dihydrofolate synthase [Betaproteobacteria bacterium]